MKAFHCGTLLPSWHLLGKKNRDDETPEMPEKNLSSTPNRTDDHIRDPKKKIRKSIQDIDKKLPK